MPCLSIIVPHFGNTGPLENTLASVLQNRPADCEVLLVHPGLYDDPYDLADEVRIIEVPLKSSLADGLNSAVQAASGEFIHVIQPGIEVDESWTQSAIARFDDPRIAAVCPLIVTKQPPQRIAEAGVKLNWLGQRRGVGTGAKNRFSKISKLKPLGPSLSAAFYRRDALKRIGWLASDVGPDLADIDIALAFTQAGYVCCFEPESVLWLVDKDDVPSRLPLASGRNSERVLWRHAPVLGGRRTIVSRLTVVAAQIAFGSFTPRRFKRSLGRVLACFEFARHRRYWRELAAIRSEEPQGDERHETIRLSTETGSTEQAAQYQEHVTPPPRDQLKRAS